MSALIPRSRPRVAAFFDLDKTIIATSSTLAMTRPLLHSGLLTNVTVIKAVVAQLQYALVGTNHDQTMRMKDQLTALVRGWDAGQLRGVVADAFDRYLEPQVHVEALEQIALHREMGHDIVIVSASAQDFVDPVAARLGVDHTLATVLEEEDGRYTGGIARYMYRQAKADAIVELAAAHGYDLSQCYAYTDSITDLPMLEAVGYPYVVNPDRALRAEANARNWRILSFHRAVNLPRRRTLSGAAALTVLGLGLLLGWLWRRKRHR